MTTLDSLKSKSQQSDLNYYSVRSGHKGHDYYIGQLKNVKIVTEIENKNQILNKSTTPCAELFEMIENSGILDSTPEQIIPSTPFPGPLSGKKYKMPILAVRDEKFIPLYVEGKRYLLDISSRDTIFTGPLPYLKLPHSPITQWIILNNNLHLMFEAPDSMVSLNLTLLGIEAQEGGFSKNVKDQIANAIYPKIYNFMEYLDLINYTCEGPLRRTYLLIYGPNDYKLLVLPHTWQRNTFGDNQELSNRRAALIIKRALETQLGRQLPPVKTQGEVNLEEYDLLDIDLPDDEIKRLYNMIENMRDNYSLLPGNWDRLVDRLVDMIMCIASRGFSDELVQQGDETVQSMILRVFKAHLDYLPYVRTPSITSHYRFGRGIMKTYHSTYREHPIALMYQPLNDLSKLVTWNISEPIIYPDDVKSILTISSRDMIPHLRGSYTVVEYNRSLNLEQIWSAHKRRVKSETGKDVGEINLDVMMYNLYFAGPLWPDLRPVGLDATGKLYQFITYSSLSQTRAVINGIEFKRDELYIFRNTPIYNALELSNETSVDLPLISLADIKLYRRYLNGDIMLKHLYDNLTDTTFRILSGDLSFLKYSELIQIRNMLDRNYISGMKFTDQLKLIKPNDDLEKQVLNLLGLSLV